MYGQQVRQIIGEFTVGTTAINHAINNRLCTVNVLEGTAWINPLGTAVANNTAIKITGAIDLVVVGNLSVISNAVGGAKVQVIVWG